MSAEGDMITSALGFEHGSLALVLASSQAHSRDLGLGPSFRTLVTRGQAQTGGSTSSHAHSSLGQSWGWIAWGLILRMTPFSILELDSTSACSASGPIHSQKGSATSSPCRQARGNVGARRGRRAWWRCGQGSPGAEHLQFCNGLVVKEFGTRTVAKT